MDMDPEQVDRFIADTLAVIERSGHVVQYIFNPDEQDPPFAYTIGLCANDAYGYELAAAGFSPDHAHLLLNRVPEVMTLHALRPQEGLEVPDTLMGLPPRLRLCTQVAHFPLVRAIYGADCDVWQVLCPDQDGRYPGEPGFEHPAAQVLL